MDFNLDNAIADSEVSKTLDAKTAPISGTSSPEPFYKKFTNPTLESNIVRTPNDEGSKFDTGYINDLNLQDYRYNNQSWGDVALAGGARLLGGALLNTGEAVTTLASAIGVGATNAVIGAGNELSADNNQTKYLSLNSITNNPVNNIFYGLEDAMKSALPVYKSSNYDNMSLMEQMTHLGWWADEGASVGAFALSNLLPAGVIGDLGLGAKVAGALGADLSVGEDAAGVANKGKGFFAATSAAGDEVGKMGKLGKYANEVLLSKSGLTNPVQFAKNIDNLGQNAYMTTSEAYFMSRDAGTAVTNKYLQDHQAKSEDELSPEQETELTAQRAKAEQYTFWGNMAALTFASHFETGFINKIFGHASADAVSGLVDSGQTVGDVVAPIQREGIDQFLNATKAGSYVKNIPKYAILEGAYKANIQNSISQVATQFGYTGKLDYIGRVLQTAKDNLTSADAYKQMGANLVVGTLMGAVGGAKEFSEQQHAVSRAVDNINSSRENIINLNNVLYQKEADGVTPKVVNGKPVYDIPALVDYSANTAQAQDLAGLHDTRVNAGDNNVADILKSEAFTKYALAHLEAGLGDELTAKVKSWAKYSDDDIAKLGYDPIELDKQGNKISIATKSQQLLDQSNQIKQDYTKVTKSIPPTADNNARVNEAVKILSRTRTLDAISGKLQQDNQENLAALVKQNPIVAQFNNKALQLAAAKNSLELAGDRISPEVRTRQETLLKNQEADLLEEKKGFADDLRNQGYEVDTTNVDPIDSEINNTPEFKALADNHFDNEDTKMAKSAQLRRYNYITDFKNGAENFNGGIVAKKLQDINTANQEEDENTKNENEANQYKEGDYLAHPDGALHQVTKGSDGSLQVNGKPLDSDFIKNNPDVRKLSDQEAIDHVSKLAHSVALEQSSSRLNSAREKQTSLNTMENEGDNRPTSSLLSTPLNKEDVLIDGKNPKARLSEDDLSKQLSSINDAKSKLKNIISDYQRQLNNPDVDKTTLEKEIQKHQDNLSKLEKSSILLEGLQNKMPNSGESGSPTKDTKEVDLNKKQASDLGNALDSIKEVNDDFTQHQQDVDNQVKEQELQHNNLVNQGPLISEQVVTNTPISVEVESEQLNESPKPVISDIFKTAASHFLNGYISDRTSQKTFGKYAEEWNPKLHHGLRAITINDPEYGLQGTKRNLYREDDEKYHTKDNIKILVVDKKGNPVLRDGEHIFSTLVEITDKHQNLEDFKWSTDENSFRGTGDKVLDKQIIEDYRAFTDSIKNSNKPVFLQIKNKSAGIQIESPRISAKEAFGEKEINLKVIQNPGKNKLTTMGGRDFNLPQGSIVNDYNGRPVSATTRTLTPLEAKQVLQKLKDYVINRGNKDAINNSQIIDQLKSIIYMGERGLDNTYSIFFIKGQEKLFFGGNLATHEDLLSGKYDEQLSNFLDNQNHQVDSKTLTDNKPYTDIFDKEWNSYQDYLTKDRGDETPLLFKIKPKSNDVDKPQFMNTYLTYQSPKLDTKEVAPQKEVSVVQSKAEATTELPFVSMSEIQARFALKVEETQQEEEIKEVVKSPANISEDRKQAAIERFKEIEGDDLFNLAKQEVKTYVKANPDEEEARFKKIISTKLDYQRTKGLIDGGNYGRFDKAGRVLVSNLATDGTSYHEGFHVVTQLYLNQGERDNLYKNWRDENPSQKDLIDRNVEEKLAEEFREYMLSDYSDSKNKSIFQRIKDYIKNLIGLGDSEKQKLFQDIGDGKYLDSKIYDNSSIDDSYYSVAKAFSPSTEKDLFDSMTLSLFNNMKNQNFSIKDLMRYGSKTLNPEDAKRFSQLYNDVLDDMEVGLEKAGLSQSNGDFIRNDLIPYLNQNSQTIALDHMKYLGIVRDSNAIAKVNFYNSLNGDVDVEELPEEERTKDTLGIIDSIQFSAKSGMPNMIKLLIAGLPRTGIDESGRNYVMKNNLGLPYVSDYKRNINILTNELAGLASLKDQVTKVNDLRLKIPEFKRLLDQLGISGDGTLSPSATKDQFLLQSKFRQQFDKNYNNFYLHLIDEDGNSHIIDSNSDRLTNIVKTKWQNGLISNPDSVKSINGEWFINNDYFSKYSDATSLKDEDLRQNVLSFYKDLGIVFSRPDIVDIGLLSDKMKVLLADIEKGDDINDIFEGHSGWMNQLLEEEIRTSLDYGDNQHISSNGKTVYNVSLNDYNAQIMNEANNHGFPQELQWNEETQTGNPLVRNSVWKDNIENKNQKFRSAYLDGARINQQGEKGLPTAKLSTGDIIGQQFTAILNGIFPFMRAADSASEKGFTFNKDQPETVRYTSLEQATDRFTKYLSDEMLSSWLHNVEGVGKDFPEYSKDAGDLRIFKGTLNESDEKLKNVILNKEVSRGEAIKEIDKFVQQDGPKRAVQDWLTNHVKDNLQILEENKVVIKNGDSYTLLGIPKELADKFVGKSSDLNEAQMKALVEQFTINHLTSNIEQTKLFTGDPAFYKDPFKRFKGLVGTGKTSWSGDDVNEWLNTNKPRYYRDKNNELKIDKKSNGKLNSWVFGDINTTSSYLEDYIKAFVEVGHSEKYARELLDSYINYKEGDAQGYMTLPEYREFYLRIGDWTDSHEAIYDKLRDGEKLNKDEVKDFFGLAMSKPQGFGPQEADSLYAPTMYKMSIMPLIPSMMKGRELEELMHSMQEQGKGLALFVSASKVANKVTNQLYDENGHINLGDNLTEQTLDYKYMKMQLDIDPTTDNKVITGTQQAKIVLSNLAGRNLTVGDKLVSGDKLISAYNDLKNKITEKRLQSLVDKLGMTKLDENTYHIKDLKPLRDILLDSANQRSVPDNILNGINEVLRDNDQKPFDVLVTRNKIENILMSLVDNNVVNQKVFGDGKVQGASTGFESRSGTKGRSLADAKKATWWSKVETANGEQDTLAFYQHDKTGTKSMEVYLPQYFKEYLGKNVDINNIDKRLVELIGFRIPTANLGQIELIKVKGFLPQEAGNLVVVPSEMVVKSGSDFDIDKLSLMFPNYTVGEDGQPQYLEYKGNEDNQYAVENRIYDLTHKIVGAPENFTSLVSPTSSKLIKDIATEVGDIKNKVIKSSPLDNGKGSVINWRRNLETREEFLDGKDGLAQVAKQNVHHILSQIVKLKANPNIKIYLDHNEVNGQVDFSQVKSVDARDKIDSPNISDIIGAFLNSFVDVANDPFIKSINASSDTIGTYLYLIRAGVPLRQAIMFMNQPIISDYIQQSKINGSLFLKANDRQLFQKGKETQSYRGIFPTIESQVRDAYKAKGTLDMKDEVIAENYRRAIETNKLENNIKNPDNLDNYVQQQILTDYLNYTDAADKLGDLIKSTSQDTNGGGATMNSAQEVLDRFEEMKESTPFENVDGYLKDTFLKGFNDAIGESVKMYKPLFFTEMNEAKQVLASIKETLKLNRFADREKALNLVKNDLINYTLQRTKTEEGRLSDGIKSLFHGENSLPKELAKTKENVILKNNLLVKELYPIISKTNADSIAKPEDLDNLKTFNRKIDTTDSNLLTEAYKELFRIQPELANKIMTFSILQSGLNNSPITYAQLIPNEEYTHISNRLLSLMKENPNFGDFEDKFYKNNYKNNDLVPRQSRPKYNPYNNLIVRPPNINERTGEKDGLDRTQYSYLKVWNKLAGNFDLWANTGEQNHNGWTIFERTNKLGDGFNLREWTDRSVIASNNIDGEPTLDKDFKEDKDYTSTKADFMDNLTKRNLPEEEHNELAKQIDEANSDEDFAKILKQFCI